jgi:hypothetical protein
LPCEQHWEYWVPALRRYKEQRALSNREMVGVAEPGPEAQKGAPWQLLSAFGLGWDVFQKMLGNWRDAGKLEGLELR